MTHAAGRIAQHQPQQSARGSSSDDEGDEVSHLQRSRPIELIFACFRPNLCSPSSLSSKSPYRSSCQTSRKPRNSQTTLLPSETLSKHNFRSKTRFG